MRRLEPKAKFQQLVERFDKVAKSGKLKEFSEADVGSKFILPFFEALGWDVKNIDEVKEQRRTLVGPADYTLNINGKPKVVVEIKKFTESLDTKRTIRGREESYPEQAIRYAWHLKVDWVVLSNFAETRLYYSHVIKPKEGLLFKFKHNEYVKNFNRMWILSKEQVRAGILDTLEKRRTRTDIDKEVLGDLFLCRKILVDTITKNNVKLSMDEIRECVQKILDRILVIRVAEDRGIIGSDSLWKQLDSWKNRGLPTPFMRSLKTIFRDFDDVYNSKLFEAHKCEDLVLENKVLEKVIATLYKYNFDLISADVLGAIYEDYIGHILKEAEKGIDIIKDYEKRKKAGIYYTPIHVVDYIIRNSLGPFLKGKQPDEMSDLKILDPACGSGSFLIKAFDVLKEYYDKYNREKLEKAKASLDLTGYTVLIYDIEKKILNNNLFGVDLDPQAAEIAAVNLMLKALRRDERLPLILGDNIKRGNSLISGEEKELKRYFGERWKDEKPFQWQSEFLGIFEAGGFDVVVGNPPHGATLSREERDFFLDKYQVAKGYKNTASLFIERATQLLKPQGIFGLVIPKSLTFSQKWKVVRDYILQNLHLLEIADISKAFPGVLLEQVILLCRKAVSKADTYRGTDLAWEEEPEKHDIPFALCKEMDAFPVHIDAESLAVYRKVVDKSVWMGKISKTSRGLPMQKKATKHKGKNTEPLLRGGNIKRYYQGDPEIFIDKSVLREDSEKIIQLRKPKIISQRIVAHVLKPRDRIIIMSTLDTQGLLSVDTVENTVVMDDKYDLRYVLAFLNSKFVSWFTYLFIFNKAVRTMDFDNYYVGKIPIFPATREQQKPLVELVEKIIILTKKLADLNVDFDRYVNSVPRETDITFKDYCTRYASEKVSLIESNQRGQIKALRVEQKNNWLILRIDYKTKSRQETRTFSNVEAFKCKINSEYVRKFLLHSLLNFKKRIGSGNIFSKIQNIEIARFHRDEGKNEKIICELMKDYLKAMDKQTTLQREIQVIDREIDQKIYRFYGLSDNEISLIEKSIPRYFIEKSFYV